MITKSLILVSALTSLVAAKVTFYGDTIELSCYGEHKDIFNFTSDDIEPIVDFRAININSCAFPANGFRVVDFITNLGLTNISQLTITNPQTPLNREHLSGLSLKLLEFSNMDVQEYPDDLLQDVELDTHLIFSGGKLTKVPKDLLKSVSGITWLEISSNKFTKISRNEFASFPNLTNLFLNRNDIEEIEEGAFNGIENLKLLELSFNKLKSLPEAFLHKLKNLQTINLSGNELTELPANLLIENSKLKSFRMNFIPGITSLPGGFFKGLRNLEFVQIASNGLTRLSADLFSGLISLEIVDIRNNKIAELPAGIFDDATELKELILEHNELTSLPDNIFSKNKLEKLNLNDNKLTNITAGHLKGLDKLTVLTVARNSLSYIYHDTLCDYLKSLKEIDVSHNQLDLEYGEFFIDRSKVFSIFLQCLYLTKINAAYNNVSHIFGDFPYLANLRNINLSNNGIQKLSASDIGNLHPNMNLNLASNKISSVDLKNLEDIVRHCSEEASTVIDIRDNPIHCDCNVVDLVRYLQDKMDDNVYNCVRLNARKLKCASPPEFANRKIIDLSLSELSCPAV